MAELGQVRNEIMEAFEGLPIPKAKHLTLGGYDHHEQKLLRSLLKGQDWRTLRRPIIEEHWASFCYLTPEAYRFYLPAFLLAALEHFPVVDNLTHAAVFNLLPSFGCLYYEGKDSQFDERLEALSSHQHLAICSFLYLFFSHVPDLRNLSAQALRWGWSRPDHACHEAIRAFYEGLTRYERPTNRASHNEDLILQITEAFATTPYPGNTSLCGSDQGDEPARYAMEFRGHAWQRLHPDFLAEHYAALSFLTPGGFRYYLPAYLIADLLGYESGANPVFSLTYGFTDATQDGRDFNVQRCVCFSDAERRAIIAYLELKAQAYEFWTAEIEQALNAYWRPSIDAT